MADLVAGDLSSSGDFVGELENVPYDILGDFFGVADVSASVQIALGRFDPDHAAVAGGTRGGLAAAVAGGARDTPHAAVAP